MSPFLVMLPMVQLGAFATGLIFTAGTIAAKVVRRFRFRKAEPDKPVHRY